MHVHAGVQVWVQRPSAVQNGTPAPLEWVPGVVAAAEDGASSVVVSLEDGQQVPCPLSSVELRGDDSAVQDLVRLTHLNEPGVLAALARRYQNGHIYTHTGSGIIIAVNPFKPMPHLYDTDAMEAYRSEGAGGGADASPPRAPHVYAVASQAYMRMREEGKGQALLVTGESGAGKTETSKLIMKYLAYLGGYKQKDNSDDGDAMRISIEQRVLESNPLLEAFGNAKTVRNDNSSRFGKYIELHFCAAGSISGARIHTYLLERSRLVAPSKGERNYHIFYQLLAGAKPDERARWRLGPDASSHRLTSMAGCLSLPGVDGALDLAVTRHAMRAVGLDCTDQEQLFSILAALLHLGDVDFNPCPSGGEGCGVGEKSEASLAAAASLLGCDAGALRKAVTTRTRVTPDGPIVSPLGLKAAGETRDAMAKVVYARLFDWLVARVNNAIGEDENRASTIGLLDIYGFESFEYNDLEQFCINLANEKLQQHFNHHVFKQEQAAYEKEGIDWSYIEFVDNQDVLDLIEGRMGLMDLIDETCRFPTASSKDLADKLLGGAVPMASPRFSRGKKGGMTFMISHYAGPVTYHTDNMLDKNRDFVISEHQALLAASSNPLARLLFTNPGAAAADAPAGPGAGPGAEGALPAKGGLRASSGNLKGFQLVSVGSQFKRQLAELSAKLSQLQPHYVRCIKPNSRNAQMEMDKLYTLEQLKCGGVMEAVRIANQGYPLRRTFGEFLDTYWPIAPHLRAARLQRRRGAADAAAEAVSAAAGTAANAAAAGGAAATVDSEEDRAAALQLLRGLCGKGDGKLDGQLKEGAEWQVGHTMVFMRAGAAAALSRLLGRTLTRAATRLQAGARGMLARREAAARRAAALALQALARGGAARALFRQMREERAATMLQSSWRGRVARAALAQQCMAGVALQALWRARQARKLAQRLRRERAALVLQCAWRGRAARHAVARLHAALLLQAAWRGCAARSAAAPVIRRHRAAVRIQRAWRLHREANPKYREEHVAAASRIQAAWRNREAIRSELRVARLRDTVVSYFALTRAALTLQCAWRRRAAARAAHVLRERKRREAFRKNAAMFESMAASSGGAAAGAGSSSGKGRALDGVKQSVFRIMANGASGSKGKLPVSREVRVSSDGGVGGEEEDRRGGPYAEVVKSEATAGREKGELLEQRVGELRDKAKVTSLLSVWQQRLSTQQQRQQQQRQRQQQLKEREQAVWQRQQQLLRQHQLRQQRDTEAELMLKRLSGPPSRHPAA